MKKGKVHFGMPAAFLLMLCGVVAATCAADDRVKSLAGEWRVSGENLSGAVHLPGTLADAKLGRRMTSADWESFEDRQSKGALTREYQYRGKAVYEREIELTADEARYPIELVMERVMGYSELAIDGETIGSCDSLATEHVYPIPPRLTKPGRHLIRLTLDNSNRYNFSEWAHSYGPVMQSVWHGVVGEFALRRQSELRKSRVFASWPANGRLVVEVPEGFEAKEGSVELARVNGQDARCPSPVVSNGQDARCPSPAVSNGQDARCPSPAVSNGQDARCPSVAVCQVQGPSPCRKGFKIVELKLDREPEAWSEHHPNLYTLTLRDEANDFTHTIRFGFRSISAHDHALWVNGIKWFMRGNLDCCHFPLTGAPATEKAWWRETFRRLRDEDGINAIRFHSWTPPKAAFDAADEMGILFAVEAGIWQDRWMRSELAGHGSPIDGFIESELRRILEARGNSPSFISIGIGNELGQRSPEGFKTMGRWMDGCKKFDPRRLYFASTAQYEKDGALQRVSGADDYFTISGRSGTYRGQLHPSTDWDYEKGYKGLPVPGVAHEVGQMPVYVDWDVELPKYTGVLRPYNLEHFRDVAKTAMPERLTRRFAPASAKMNRMMYKDNVEGLLRTPSCAGLQLLSVQDFTGQFEAMIGWRDSFYDLKPAVKDMPRFRNVFNELPHLARFEKYCWSAGETYKATLVLRNLTEKPILEGTEFGCSILGQRASCPLKCDALGQRASCPLTMKETVLRLPKTILPGEVGTVGEVALPLTEEMAGKRFLLKFGTNSWPFWVFGSTGKMPVVPVALSTGKMPVVPVASPTGKMPVVPVASSTGNMPVVPVTVTASFDEAVDALKRGGRVLYTGMSAHSMKSRFRPVFWSAGHFNNDTSYLASLGYCIDADHPALRGFPTEDSADWQWYNLVEGGIKHGLAGLPDFEPIVMPVSDLHYSTPMGMLFELKAGDGRLMVCGLNLSDLTKPEVRAMRASILSYMESAEFNPAVSVEIEKFASKPQGLRLASYNIRHCRGKDGKVDVRRVADAIMREKPDIVGLNEVDCRVRRSGNVDEAEELGRIAGLNATFAKAIPLQGGGYGNAILSREEPLSVERIPLPGKEPRVLLLCEFKDFWFGTAHLDFGRHQLPSVEIIRGIVGEKSKTKPVFLAGDWNATPKSGTLAAMKGFMTVVSKESCRTFHGFKNHPPESEHCIDYIAVDSAHAAKVKVNEAHVTPNAVASDHNPIAVQLTFAAGFW